MSRKATWLKMNVEELNRRTIKFKSLNYGRIIVLHGENKDRISLMLCDETKTTILIENLISYQDLVSAKTLDQRLQIVLDAVRDFNFMFYFDENVSRLINNG